MGVRTTMSAPCNEPVGPPINVMPDTHWDARHIWSVRSVGVVSAVVGVLGRGWDFFDTGLRRLEIYFTTL